MSALSGAGPARANCSSSGARIYRLAQRAAQQRRLIGGELGREIRNVHVRIGDARSLLLQEKPAQVDVGDDRPAIAFSRSVSSALRAMY